ncbi:hypothetical protein AX769_10145 [Frondihabitans sp. PAMC 28766]|uniref:hypothetical protein n=1 Tax=Frondihabitans sp. PAMC 28766 TaxID=1795630 RepID=UPI00078DA252|nr:hypothetical protein [Frondihabitans sp. PAMC 28766]AMM20443.1 hypothetical protein AX769_10145 [Frondihabitans sp. PAMC 28766]
MKSYSSVGMTATNGGAHPNDPQVHLPISAFNGSTYHYLSFDLTYDGPFSLSASKGGGKLARLIWNVKGTSTAQQSNDIVTYSGANAKTISTDLASGNPLDEDSGSPRAGWAKQLITSLRFDPNEDPGANTWHLKDIHLRAQPSAKGSTTVVYHDAAWVSGTTADIAVSNGGAYSTIASGVDVKQGSNSAVFTLGSRPAGSYRIRVILHHPNGTVAQALSNTSITMATAPRDTSHDPSGRVENIVRVPGGVSEKGWVRDPDTASPVTVRFYDGANYLTETAASLPRADVKKAYPSAPLDTGFSKVIAVADGKHNVCTYGINVGAGANTGFGCHAVNLLATPYGRLDSVSRSGTSAKLVGWAIDPDTASPISVRFYVNGKYVGATPANVTRTDVAKVYPGYGTAHGYSATVKAAAGSTVCSYGIDSAGKTNSLLGCKKV